MDGSGLPNDYYKLGNYGECFIDALTINNSEGATVFRDDFDSLQSNWGLVIDTNWPLSVVADGRLRISGYANTYGFLTMPFPTDLTNCEITCVIDKGTDSSYDWAPGIMLRWSNGRWFWVDYRVKPDTYNVCHSYGSGIFQVPPDRVGNLHSSKGGLVFEEPEMLSNYPQSNAFRVADMLGGKVIKQSFYDPYFQVAGVWKAVLLDDVNYIREEVQLISTGQVGIESYAFRVFFPENACVSQVGSVAGSPIRLGNFFFSAESPFAKNFTSPSNVVSAVYYNGRIPPNEPLCFSSVLGVAPDGQFRRGFQYYLATERACKYRPFLHYNSWFDTFLDVSANRMSNVISLVDQELRVKRGVHVDAYVIDDGWDNPDVGLWEPDPVKFPQGFYPIYTQLAQIGSGLGLWISPLGGYYDIGLRRLQRAIEEGIVTGSFDLGQDTYYAWFLAKTANLVSNSGVSYFKWDRAGTGANLHFYRLFAIAKELRSLSPALFINLTVGSWPSPFWLLGVDSIWRGGEDVGFYGAGSMREQWITYRDMQLYGNIVTKAPLYPINSLMLHGIVNGSKVTKLYSYDPDLRSECRSFFGSGINCQELYLTPEGMGTNSWEAIAEAARWSRTNAEVLEDSRWIGGNPMSLEVYGWASWHPKKGIVVLRNPSAETRSFTFDLRSLLELPVDVPSQYMVSYPFPDQQAPFDEISTDSLESVNLAPFEVLVMELTPICRYQEWASNCMKELDEAARLPHSDPDGDGIINLVEYCVGTDPLTADGSTYLWVESCGDEVHVWYVLRAGQLDWKATLEQSFDLQNWHQVPETELRLCATDFRRNYYRYSCNPFAHQFTAFRISFSQGE